MVRGLVDNRSPISHTTPYPAPQVTSVCNRNNKSLPSQHLQSPLHPQTQQPRAGCSVKSGSRASRLCDALCWGSTGLSHLPRRGPWPDLALSWLLAPGLLLTTGQHILWPLQTLPGLHVCPGLTSKDYKILNLLLACPCPWLSSSPSPAHKTHPEWPVSTIGKEATSHSSGVKGEAQYSYPIDPASLSLQPKVFPSALKKRVLTWWPVGNTLKV